MLRQFPAQFGGHFRDNIRGLWKQRRQLGTEMGFRGEGVKEGDKELLQSAFPMSTVHNAQ